MCGRTRREVSESSLVNPQRRDQSRLQARQQSGLATGWLSTEWVTTIGAYEAKTHLPRLLDEVERGKAVVITRHGRPVARLVPVGPFADPEALLDRVGAQGAIVPTIWFLEVANVLLVAERRGWLTDTQATLSSYDASYVGLAETSGLPLATLDARLSEAALLAGVELLLAP